jgi:hypothetical protein
MVTLCLLFWRKAGLDTHKSTHRRSSRSQSPMMVHVRWIPCTHKSLLWSCRIWKHIVSGGPEHTGEGAEIFHCEARLSTSRQWHLPRAQDALISGTCLNVPGSERGRGRGALQIGTCINIPRSELGKEVLHFISGTCLNLPRSEGGRGEEVHSYQVPA